MPTTELQGHSSSIQVGCGEETRKSHRLHVFKQIPFSLLLMSNIKFQNCSSEKSKQTQLFLIIPKKKKSLIKEDFKGKQKNQGKAQSSEQAALSSAPQKHNPSTFGTFPLASYTTVITNCSCRSPCPLKCILRISLRFS